MDDPRRHRNAATRARAAVRAQRWAIKHRPKPRSGRQRPVLTAAAVMLGSVVAGVLIGTGLEYGLPGGGGAWVVPLTPEPETGPPSDSAAQPEAGGDAVLAPAAGPGPGPRGFAYEEPQLPDEPVRGPSAEEIEAMVRDSGLAPIASGSIAAPEEALWERNALADVGHGDRVAFPQRLRRRGDRT